MNQHTRITLALDLWVDAALDDDALATFVRTRLPMAFGEAITFLKDPVTVLDIQREADLYSREGA